MTMSKTKDNLLSSHKSKLSNRRSIQNIWQKEVEIMTFTSLLIEMIVRKRKT